MARISQHHEDAVAVVRDRLVAHRHASRQGAGENLNHQRQAEALVGLLPAHRQDAARWVGVKRMRIAGGSSLAIDQPTVGTELAGELADAYLSLRIGAGAEI